MTIRIGVDGWGGKGKGFSRRVHLYENDWSKAVMWGVEWNTWGLKGQPFIHWAAYRIGMMYRRLGLWRFQSKKCERVPWHPSKPLIWQNKLGCIHLKLGEQVRDAYPNSVIEPIPTNGNRTDSTKRRQRQGTCLFVHRNTTHQNNNLHSLSFLGHLHIHPALWVRRAAKKKNEKEKIGPSLQVTLLPRISQSGQKGNI